MRRTYGRLSLAGGAYAITDLEPHVALKLKAIFPKVPKHARAMFTFPADPITAEDLGWFMDRYPLMVDPVAGELLARDRGVYREQQAEVGRIMAPDYQPRVFVGLKPGQEVRTHQARAAELLSRFGGLLVADDMGEGKTYTGGACCLLPGALPATVVCPPHLKGQWRKKLTEFTTLSVHVIEGTRPYNVPPVDVRIFSFTQLAGWIDVLELLGTGLLILDEGHELRRGVGTTYSPVAKGIAAMRLAEVSRLKLMLTGTPVFNYGDEIFNLLSFIRPEVLGDQSDFNREWCHGREVKDPEALGAFLREQHAMIRKKGDGPPPNRIVESVDYDAGRLDSIEDYARELARIATTASFEERGRATRELDLRIRQETGVAKAPFVAKFVRLLVEASGEPVVLFGWHRDVYDIWLEALSDLGCVMYTGTEGPAQKMQAQQRFLAGEAKVFIMSLRSGAGLDGLQHVAHRCVFGELDWSPAMHDQCIGRLNREGQRCWPEPVTAIFLTADDGSDPPMMEVLGIKASQAHHIVDAGLGPQRRVEDKDGLKALIRRYAGEKVA